MRNTVQLYIEGVRADLDNSSFLLMNYTAEELSNPTIVRNTFSRQITLKGTPQNDLIFGGIFRHDRNTVYGSPYVGPNFDPTRKTAFTIYADEGILLESGYLKLDSIETRGRSHSYKVTLYGGLGSFLYGLSYDGNGDKLSLADLDYGETIGFTITRTVIANAWARLGGDTSKPAQYDIINFAPCYNGKPSKPFDAGKCVVYADTAGLPSRRGDYTSQGGFVLVSLDEDVTEQEAKDYRSYLQRPVLSVKELINAICDPSNNGGWTVNKDAEFFDASNPYWDKAWISLPMMQDLNIDTVSSDGTVSCNSLGTRYSIPGGGNISTKYSLVFNLSVVCNFDSVHAYTNYVMHLDYPYPDPNDPDQVLHAFYINWIEYEIRFYDSNNSVIETVTFRVSTADWHSMFTEVPPMDYLADYMYVDWNSDLGTFGGRFYRNGQPVSFVFQYSGFGVASFSIHQTVKGLDPFKRMMVWEEGENDYAKNGTVHDYYLESGSARYASVSSTTVRTGANISKTALLSGEHTPADYLLSYCKTFGLQLVVDNETKVVDITMRKNLYSASVVDISGRIDRAKPVTKKPFAFDARWYAWKNGYKGEFADYYASKYGLAYGQMRVNTGYDFDANEKALTDDILFQGACDVLETSKYFCELDDGSINVPAVFLAGGQYTLYKAGGDSEDFDLPNVSAIGKEWLDPSHPMHDDMQKPQFHGSDNGHLDIRDVLLIYNGMYTPSSDHITLSDDTMMMLGLNGNNPCWLPGYCDHYVSWKLSSMPKFLRGKYSGNTVTDSLDFGTPKEAQMPVISYNAGSDIFSQFWSKYIGDRYDDDSAVVTCYVDLQGWEVNETLLRRFYAFDGAVWALNRIIDHSLTTFGPTKCEFVKVQDTTNYTTL